MKRLLLLLFLVYGLDFALCDGLQAQQMTRLELLKKFYRAGVYEEKQQDSLAIAELEQIAQLYPRMPITYLRMAKVYDGMASRDGNVMAMNGAIAMYRRYLSLEFDTKKTAEASQRLKELETKMNLSHFEEDDEKKSQAEDASEDVVPTILASSESAGANGLIAQLEQPTPIGAVEQPTPIGAVEQPTPIGAVEQPTPIAAAGQPTPIGAVEQPTPIAAVEQPTPIASVGQPAQTGGVVRPASGSPVIGGPAEGETGRGSCDYIVDMNDPTLSHLVLYDIQLPASAVVSQHKPLAMDARALTGHWVSSLANEDGREYWIFDISPFGSKDCNVELHSESGIINPVVKKSKTFFSRMMNFLKTQEVLANSTFEFPISIASGTIKEDNLTFEIESERRYKPAATIYSFTHSILEGLSSWLPFGQALFKMGDNIISGRQKKDVESVITNKFTFSCNLIAPDVLECTFRSQGKRSSASGSKSLRGESGSFYLYRMPSDYVYFNPLDEADLASSSNYETLFRQVEQDAKRDFTYAYPLAILYYYGIGVKESAPKAFTTMSGLADKYNCPRAQAWLALQYFIEAYDENNDLSKRKRRSYLEASDSWLARFRKSNPKQWYAIKGDMFMMAQADETAADSALYYYRQGAAQQDPYACFRYAQYAMDGIAMPRNMTQALDFYQIASDGGYPDAILEMARQARRQGDDQTYLQMLGKAVDRGSDEALLELSKAYFEGRALEHSVAKGRLMRQYWYDNSHNKWKDILAAYGYDTMSL